MTMNANLNFELKNPQNPSTPRSHLKEQLHARQASLTDNEMAFLSALLVDPPMIKKNVGVGLKATTIDETKPLLPESEQEKAIVNASKVLDNDMLFTVPATGIPYESEEEHKRPKVSKRPSQYRFLVGLWQAFEDGVSPHTLSSLYRRSTVKDFVERIPREGKEQSSTKFLSKEAAEFQRECNESEADLGDSVRSDIEVRSTNSDNLSELSWYEDETKRFDAWQVLKDEYAKDYGFDFNPDGALPSEDDESLEPNTFKILGTSAEDQNAHPHVLSPPLMDAILNFVPEHLKGQNLWMKYSLIRDGASLETFKRYARASKHTILAIETTKGHVFGCFASQPWRTAPSFYGGAPSFVFKMRYNRGTLCHSLIEQAQLESEIDVFFLLENDQRPQVCTSKMVGIGQGALQAHDEMGAILQTTEDAEATHGKTHGFAIALGTDLLSGTSSQSSSYKNPCLVNSSSHGEPFEVLNLELWTFTPCFSLESAEQLEMTQFFVQQSIRNVSITSTTSGRTNSERSAFSSEDFDREKFYRRVGHGDDHEEIRERWQYRNMMDGGVSGPRGIGASPRFSN